MKAKGPSKKYFFLWYLKQDLILTKDNLAKRNWSGSQKCCLCDYNQSIKHLFFYCQHSKTIWRFANIATRLTPPKSIAHMLGNWLITMVNFVKIWLCALLLAEPEDNSFF
jgi:hypothetical protein